MYIRAHRSSVRLEMGQRMQSICSGPVSETRPAMHVSFQQPREKYPQNRKHFLWISLMMNLFEDSKRTPKVARCSSGTRGALGTDVTQEPCTVAGVAPHSFQRLHGSACTMYRIDFIHCQSRPDDGEAKLNLRVTCQSFERAFKMIAVCFSFLLQRHSSRRQQELRNLARTALTMAQI